MHIKSIVFEGFKSYGRRVELDEFDQYFNAITGSYGTGKSNILDGICFVFGISKLPKIRAGGLRDLVFKRGSTGLNSATVTIIFENTDRRKSPIGYENMSEIKVARKIIICSQTCKSIYYINGTSTPRARIQDLFHSVQLNVNNPNFLIMQGKITKVLNMNPSEVLSMVEEAVGTHMFDTQKINAENAIAKKDVTLSKMSRMLYDFVPYLQIDEENRTRFLEWQKMDSQYQYKKKIGVAFKYTKIWEKKEQENDKLQRMAEEINNMKIDMAQLQRKADNKKKKIEALQKIVDEEIPGELKSLQDELEIAKSEDSVARIAYMKSSFWLQQDVDEFESMKKHFNEDQEELNSKETTLEQLSGEYEISKTEERYLQTALKKAEERLNAAYYDLFASDDSSTYSSFQEQLTRAITNEMETETKIKIIEMDIKYNTEEMEASLKDADKCSDTFALYQEQHDTLNNLIQSLKAELESLKYEDGQLKNLNEQRLPLSQEIQNLTDQLRNLKKKNRKLIFEYTDPEPNFNKSSIRGMACEFYKVKDNRYVRGLEGAAGSKLYHVVVDDCDVASKLINDGGLRHRTTFLPLDMITGNVIPDSIIEKVQKSFGREKVYPALSLITYEPEYHPVMNYLFGDAFICEDDATAHKVAFDMDNKCVTLNGNAYIPPAIGDEGCLGEENDEVYGEDDEVHGEEEEAEEMAIGYQSGTESVLHLASEIKPVEEQLNEKTNMLKYVDDQIKSVTSIAERYRYLKLQLQTAMEEFDDLQDFFRKSIYYKYKEEAKTLQYQIANLKTEVEDLFTIEKKHKKKVSEIKEKLKNSKAIKNRTIRAAKSEIANIKHDLEELRKTWKNDKESFEDLTMDVNVLKNYLAENEGSLSTMEKSVEKQKIEHDNLKLEHETKKKILMECQEKIKAKNKLFYNQNCKLIKTRATQNALLDKIADAELSILEGMHKQKIMSRYYEGFAKEVQAFEEQYDWIVHDRDVFGKSGGAYDFTNINYADLEKEIKRLKEMAEKLKEGIDVEKAKKDITKKLEFNHLKSKMDGILDDKNQILSVLQDLKSRKKMEIEDAWKKISKNFGNVFNVLLPGATAKLDLVEGKSLEDGLEIKVCIGDKWIANLDELSGGQKSLAALAFIFSMLLYNPAPIYILDEIDAALDPSITGSIGLLIKKYFTQAQFIIVSLKHGMYTKANVIFQTSKNEDISTVTQILGHK